jgi:hypothetical protein
MAQGMSENQDPIPALSERIERYRREVQSLVKQGVEHSQFEFKRAASILRQNLDDRLDFIKLLQGIANAEIFGERFIVIGADPTEKTFYPISNSAEFDQATVSTVVAKYLDPTPNFDVFNNLQTDEGQPFVLIVLGANQPRPIMVKTEGKRTDGKTRLSVGDIWIKDGTALRTASRADIDSMYRLRMEDESEDRARKRLRHFIDISNESSPPSFSRTRLPVRKLLVGPEPEFRDFVEEIIAENDRQRFLMLLEFAREALVEGWDEVDVREPGFPADVKEFVLSVNDFWRDEFLPSIRSLVSIGLMSIKYDFHIEGFQSVIDTLVDAFEAGRGLQRLKIGQITQEPSALPWWRPAFEIYVALKCLASYALRRNRTRFLAAILPRLVNQLTVDDRQSLKTPILFWPLPSGIFSDGSLKEGRSASFWKERISTSWGEYFGTYENFLGPACQQEFLLELNSYLGTNTLDDARIRAWQETEDRDVSFTFIPDLLAYDLRWTVPMAERCYDLIASGKPFPSELAVKPELFELAFKDKNREQRLLIYGGFLHHLKAWQATTMFQGLRRFPFMYDWEGRLLQIVKRYREQNPKQS